MKIPKFIGWIGFLPDTKYEVSGETWLYETTQTEAKDGKFIVTLHITKPIKAIHSTHNAHP